MNRILMTCKQGNFRQGLALASTYGLGIEIQSFAFPPLLGAPDWEDTLESYAGQLRGFSGELAVHGAFMDMVPGSPDPLFLKITAQRTQEGLRIASRLGAKTLVFHANFITTIRNDDYRESWTQRMVDFFGPFADQAQQIGVKIVLENMWEFDPSIIRRVLEGVNSPSLMACLDVGHSQLFSDLPLEDWLQDLDGWIRYLHINNNYGEIDEHLGLDDGVLNYTQILPRLHRLPDNPALTLEIERVEDIERSLAYFQLT